MTSTGSAKPVGSVPATDKVPLSGRIGFGMGEFGFVILFHGTGLFLLYFYTDILGIDPFVAGFIYLIAMIWDAVIDPIVATIVDKTRTKMGRYRPWLLAGAIPFGLSYPLAFSNPEFLPVGVWMWALGTHIAFRTAYTIASMPYNSLQARLTPDSGERTVLAASRMIGAASAVLFISLFTPITVGNFGAEQGAEGYFFVACVAGTITAICILSCFFLVREPPETEEKGKSKPFFEDLVSVLPMIRQNGQLVRIIMMIVTGTAMLGMFSSSILYHYEYDVQNTDLIVFALVGTAGTLIFAVPIWVKIANVTSKRKAVMSGLAIAFVGYVGFFLNPSQNFPIAISFIVLNAFGISAFFGLFWSMFADTLEYGELKTGIREEAKTFAFATFAQKAAVGVNALLLGGLLSLVGFEANTVQSEATLTGMKATMALVPAAGVLFMMWLVNGYKLDRETHDKIRAELDERKRSLAAQAGGI